MVVVFFLQAEDGIRNYGVTGVQTCALPIYIFNRQTGEKFLCTILEKGGSEEAIDLFVAFRGREPEIDALLQADGLA